MGAISLCNHLSTPFFKLSHRLPSRRFQLFFLTIQTNTYNYRLYENPTHCSRKQTKHTIWWVTNFPHNLSHNLNRTVSSLNSSESRCSLQSSSACRIRLSVHLASNMSYHVQRIWHLISSKFNFVSIVISINVINTTN